MATLKEFLDGHKSDIDKAFYNVLFEAGRRNDILEGGTMEDHEDHYFEMPARKLSFGNGKWFVLALAWPVALEYKSTGVLPERNEFEIVDAWDARGAK